MNEVIVLIPGYAEWLGPGRQRASGTVTLIKGQKNVIVDTGTPHQRDQIVQQLEECGLATNDVDWVVITHGSSDHLGNNNLFPEATFLLDRDVSSGDEYWVHNFKEDALAIAPGVSVIQTIGHAGVVYPYRHAADSVSPNSLGTSKQGLPSHSEADWRPTSLNTFELTPQCRRHLPYFPALLGHHRPNLQSGCIWH